MSPKEHDRIVGRLIEAAGHTTQSMGLGRVIGQIFTCLYLSPKPRSLNDLTRSLGISKGSASMCVRQLEQWGAVERVWVKGDRKDYYRAGDRFGAIIKNAVIDLVGKRMETSNALLRDVDATLREPTVQTLPSTDEQFFRERVEKLRAFQQKANGMWNSKLLRMLLK